jgi:hypothetical protein
MNSDIAALWAKAFVHIAKLSEIAHTDRMNAQVEAKLARIRLGHLITHVSESQASAEEYEFRRLDCIQTLSARMSGLLETIERNANWFDTCKASIPQGVTLYGSALDRERRTAAMEALERVLMSIEELAECCKVEEVTPTVYDEPALSPEELREISRLGDIETKYDLTQAKFFRDALDKQKEGNLSDHEAAGLAAERYVNKLPNTPYKTFNKIKKWVRENRVKLRARVNEEKCKSCNPVA